jgi:broad specificity phosphatase PhoE
VAQRLHLVRHGEVHNPDHVVYAGLPGFGLTPAGTAQALAAARHLAGSGAAIVISSPLQRAVETATPIADALGVTLRLDERLTEWGLATRWAGVVWEDLPTRFPGELEAYLATPADLPFAPETLAAVAERMAAVVAEIGAGDAVLVSHQDPVQAARIALTGGSLADLGVDKPSHASVISLERTAEGWRELSVWEPPDRSAPFPPPA